MGQFYYLLVNEDIRPFSNVAETLHIDGTFGVDVSREGKYQGLTFSSKFKTSTSSGTLCYAVAVTNSKEYKIYLDIANDVKFFLDLKSIKFTFSDFESNFSRIAKEVWTNANHFYCYFHLLKNIRKNCFLYGLDKQMVDIVCKEFIQMYSNCGDLEDVQNELIVKPSFNQFKKKKRILIFIIFFFLYIFFSHNFIKLKKRISKEELKRT